jgi:ZIP family zinc transporter
MVEFLQGYNVILVGFIASVAAGCATGVGAIPIFFTKDISHKFLDAMLGFAAGVMLAATSFSLIVPAIEYGGGGVKGATITLSGILLGGIFLDLIDKYAPHEHLLEGRHEGNDSSLKKVWLFIIAITLHNPGRSGSWSRLRKW